MTKTLKKFKSLSRSEKIKEANILIDEQHTLKPIVETDTEKFWISYGHIEIEFYTLSDKEKQEVFEQIKTLQSKLDELKSYTGYEF
jgi:hypothetical protein